MLNRKVSVAVAFALGLPFAGAAYAATPFTGPYVGVQAGYSVYDIKLTASDASIPENETIEGLSASGAEGGLYAGWGTKLSPTTYAGLEGEYSWSGAQHKTSLTDAMGTATGKIEDKNNYGISGRLGWLPTSNTMLYMRAGWQRAKLDYSGDIAGVGSGSISKTHDGLRLGLGTEVAMTSDWLLRLDYAHSFYGKKSETAGTASLESKPRNDVFRIGIARQF
jgi:outer membrane immunogenic protein